MAFEASRTQAWVYDTVTGSAPVMALLVGGFWLGLVPADKGIPSDANGEPVPYGILSVASAPDHVTGNQTRVWNEPLLSIRLYALKHDEASLEAAADGIDTLLQKPAPGQATSRGGKVLACYRESILAEDVVEAGRTLRRYQLLYRAPTQV